ncbi:hypothetical protein AB9C22_24050, partial [Escherichia coli]
HHAFSSGAGRTSDGNGSHASTLKSPSYTKSVSWQHYQQLKYNNERNRPPAITPYTEKNNHQNNENNPDENTEKNHLKKNETTYAGRKNKPPISPTGIVAVLSVIREKVYAHIREKIRGRYKWEGKEGYRHFLRINSSHSFHPP